MEVPTENYTNKRSTKARMRTFHSLDLDAVESLEAKVTDDAVAMIKIRLPSHLANSIRNTISMILQDEHTIAYFSEIDRDRTQQQVTWRFDVDELLNAWHANQLRAN
jgi:hypothetical protein